LEEVVAGLDVGTSSIKLVLYGKKGVIYSERIDHSEGRSNGREIDPVQLIKDVIYLIRKSKDRNKNVKVKAIGLSSLFPSFIALDEKGKPLTKIITWMDSRGDELVIKYKKRKKEAAKLQEKTGCVVHESYTLWKILWLKENNMGIFSRASKFLSLPDYLTYKLTGKFAISYALASTTGLFNINSLEWDKEILKMVGTSERQLSECYSIYHAEKLLKKIRLKMGLDEDAVLVLGAGDGHLSNIGSGCVTDKTICSTIGTSSALRIVEESQRYNNKSVWKHYLYDKKYMSGIAINAGSSTLAWFYKNIFHKESNSLFNDIDKIDLDRSTDMIFLPFLDGERGPNYNQKMSASLFGLNTRSTDSDIYKAAIEGIIFNLYDCYRILVNRNKGPEEMVATGGYINSEKILQMQSDIFNIKIKVPSVKEASAVGAAFVSLVAIGKERSRLKIKTEYEKLYLPDPVKHSEYMKKYRKYKELYDIISKIN
jgi:gluconokinase